MTNGKMRIVTRPDMLAGHPAISAAVLKAGTNHFVCVLQPGEIFLNYSDDKMDNQEYAD